MDFGPFDIVYHSAPISLSLTLSLFFLFFFFFFSCTKITFFFFWPQHSRFIKLELLFVCYWPLKFLFWKMPLQKKKARRYFYEKKTPAQEENQSVIIFRAHASYLIKNRWRTMWPGWKKNQFCLNTIVNAQ